MLKSAKLGLLRVMRAAGGLALVRDSRWRSERVLILGYHGISLEDEHQWNGELYITAERLRARLAMLAAGGYTVLPLDAAVRGLYAGSLPPRAAVITFDDGFHDFSVLAQPLLREFRMPATVYLTTYYCEHPLPVFDLMCPYLVWKGRGRTVDASGLRAAGGTAPTDTVESRHALVRDIRAFVYERGDTAAKKDDLLRELAGRLGVNYSALLERRLLHLMTPAEVAALDRTLIQVELHTHRHRVPLDDALFRREIEDNRRSIERLVGRSAEHLCYPSGVISPEFPDRLTALGVQSGTTCELGLASRADSPLLLPRLLDTSTLSEAEFEGWLTGVASLLPRRPLMIPPPTRDGVLP